MVTRGKETSRGGEEATPAASGGTTSLQARDRAGGGRTPNASDGGHSE